MKVNHIQARPTHKKVTWSKYYFDDAHNLYILMEIMLDDDHWMDPTHAHPLFTWVPPDGLLSRVEVPITNLDIMCLIWRRIRQCKYFPCRKIEIRRITFFG